MSEYVARGLGGSLLLVLLLFDEEACPLDTCFLFEVDLNKKF